jgi:hypothetical protein
LERLKSSRHSKITGDFGEHLIKYWLSRRGFETAIIDHIGIDLISNRPKKRLGISVKMRSKIKDNKIGTLNIEVAAIKKVTDACKAFGCVPYFAIVADQNGRITAILISLKELLKLYPKANKIIAFGLSDNQVRKYKANKKIEFFELRKTQDGTW